MRVLSQAIRAVVIEMLGVVLVLWLLFGTAAWTVSSYSSAPSVTPTSNTLVIEGMLNDMLSWTELPAKSKDSEEVARVLDHYSAAYRELAGRQLGESSAAGQQRPNSAASRLERGAKMMALGLQL